MNKSVLKLAVIVGVLIVWGIALFSPVFYSKAEPDGMPGISALFMGWLYLDLYSWLATFVLVIAMLFFLFNRFTISMLLSVVALILMLNFLRIDFYYKSSSGSTTELITERGFGYWIWLLSAVELIIGSLIVKFSSNNLPNFSEK